MKTKPPGMKTTPLILAFLMAVATDARELLDPRLRDESISDTTVSVRTDRLGQDLYKYTYSITSPSTNKGRILMLSIDLSCEMELVGGNLPEAVKTDAYLGDLSEGDHVPVVFDFSESKYFYIHGVSVANTADWTLGVNPGDSIDGLTLFSSAPPGPVSYTLRPSISTAGWDYDSYAADDPDVPWVEDFTVSGTVEGPACPKEE